MMGEEGTKYKTKSTRRNEKYLVVGGKNLPEAEAATGREGSGPFLWLQLPRNKPETPIGFDRYC